MVHCRMLSALGLVFALAACALGEVYVSPAGNNANAGSSDRPVATLAKAIELSRAIPADQPKRIVVGGGRYYDVSGVLTAADSNLTIEAAAGERPMLYGGVPLNGWQKDGDRFYAAGLPEGRAWDVRLLQVNGRFCPRARFPKEGTLTHLSQFDVPWMSTTGGGWKRKPTAEELTTLKYKAGDLPATLDIKNAEITVYHMWDESVAGIASHDVQNQILKLAPELGHPGGGFGVQKYNLWNLREGMTTPGQWYFDRSNRRIVYWPLPNEDMSQAQVIVPTVSSILRIEGAKNVTIRNLDLAVTTVPLITGGFAAANFDGAVSLNHTENCTLSGLRIRNVAGQGIKAKRDGSATRVENCEIISCGAGGIYVGGAGTVIANNLVRSVGLAYPSAIGIHGGGKKCLLRHNEIHDTPYSAVGYGGEETVMEYNLIYDCMKVLHDGGAIYVFGGKRCILRGNVARDIPDTGGYGSSSYYLDEQSEGCVVEENLSVNVERPSHNHMARSNTIRNNVFITSGDLRITFPRSSGYTLEGNVLYSGGRIVFENIDGVATWSRNVVFSGANRIEGITLKDYSATGTVNGVRGDTVVADPLFLDLAKGDYRYKETSAALRLSLPKLDFGKSGRIKQ